MTTTEPATAPNAFCHAVTSLAAAARALEIAAEATALAARPANAATWPTPEEKAALLSGTHAMHLQMSRVVELVTATADTYLQERQLIHTVDLLASCNRPGLPIATTDGERPLLVQHAIGRHLRAARAAMGTVSDQLEAAERESRRVHTAATAE